MPMMLPKSRLSAAKRAFTTRRLPESVPLVLLTEQDDARPMRAGDLVLARVDRIGHHTKIERPDGRKARLFPGDEVILTLGARYAPDQYEAAVPTALGPCHLAAAGGVAGRITSIHDRIIRPTEITLLGQLSLDGDRPANLCDFSMPQQRSPAGLPTIGVIGTAMNAGKTTAAAGLIHGLSRAGLRVGAAKITGTGAGGDYWFYRDAGAHHVLDFVDAGYASTFREPTGALVRTTKRLVGQLANAGCEIAVVEISDGIYQRESAALLESPVFREAVPQLLFATREAAGGVIGVGHLRALGYDVLAVSGLIARAPLAVEEFLDRGTHVPVHGYEALCDPETALELARPALEDKDAGLDIAS